MKRRTLIAATAAIAARVMAMPPERSKPRPGDILVHAFGDRSGEVIRTGDVFDAPVLAFPKGDGVVRSGSLHNELLLLRLDEALMTPRTMRYAAGPFVAYSAACTHTGCEVSGWDGDARQIICPCHGSRFEAFDAARVAQGPAPKPLAMLMIERDSDTFRVSGGFSRRVGPEPL